MKTQLLLVAKILSNSILMTVLESNWRGSNIINRVGRGKNMIQVQDVRPCIPALKEAEVVTVSQSTAVEALTICRPIVPTHD